MRLSVEKEQFLKALNSASHAIAGKNADPVLANLKLELNERGLEITGTNTMFEGIPVGPRKAGDDIVITFRQKMDLQGGEYLLSFGCTGYMDGDFRVFHRLYDILNVTCVSPKNTVGFYDMNSQITTKLLN